MVETISLVGLILIFAVTFVRIIRWKTGKYINISILPLAEI